MHLIIERLNGQKFISTNHGMKILQFVVSSPKINSVYEEVAGRSGLIDMGTTYGGRDIMAEILFWGVDGQDTPLVRNSIFQILDSKELFYVADSREPDRRWLIRCDTSFTPEQFTSTHGKFNVQFISPLSYAESIGTTLQPITFRNNPALLNLGLNLTENDYVKTINTFKIFNAGERIDPREGLPLKIHFKGSCNNLRILNNTNNTEWRYNATASVVDQILFDGIRSYKNGISMFRDTNYGVVELEKGWNEFTVSGATNFEIKFDHRFYYL